MNSLVIRISQSALLLILLMHAINYAQTTDADSSTSFIEENIQLSGELGTYCELYSISGIEKRRPSSTGRLFFRPTLTLFNLINIPFEFLISTEGSEARQNFNQFGITPTWEWGRAGLGDFTESYSEHTLNGIQLRGAGINIFPGIIRFAVASGFTRRAVDGGAANGSYDRFLFASKVGIGLEESSFIDLIFLRAKDKVGSLENPTAGLDVLFPNGDDQLPIGSIQTIKWTSAGIPGNVKIELSRDGGNTFEVLFSDVSNTGFTDWTVSGSPSYSAVIKITSLTDSSIFDVSDYSFIIDSGIDFIEGSIQQTVENPYAVTPQENLIVGLNGKLTLFENMIEINLETAGSAFTRDLRADEVDVDSTDLPAFVNDIFKLRTGSNVDYFVNTSVGLNLESVNAKFGYKRIGPGYASLGLPYLINDQQEFWASTSFRIDKYGIGFNYMHVNDNLLNQKLFTTSRNQFGLNVNGMLTDSWNAGVLINILNMENDSGNDTSRIDFSNLVLGTNHAFIFSGESLLQNILINYTYQESNNKSALIETGKSFSHSASLNFTFILIPNLSAALGSGIINSVYADSINNTTNTFTVSARHRAFENQLNTTLSLNASRLKDNSTYRTSFSTAYSLTMADRVSVTISYMKYNGTGLRKSFNEVTASLSYSHQF